MQGVGSCGVEGVALGESPLVLRDCQPWDGLGCSGEAGWAQPVKAEGLGHKANDCPQLTRLLGAEDKLVS